eukprot:TRINITY_DN1412_c0_g2_i3.p1 TRINITY_DN1412_c0_g2~~TRINITY_DN1412_c0_g2_i3.p1  ORF type:complete len:514 (+),score=166.55 TRINITY_DN1412_c0_g2_i3:50-1591(+)
MFNDEQQERAREGGQSSRVDVEAENKFAQIVELFVSGGYFRARIQGLSQFDKILGGLAWAISASNYELDLDIFQENAPLGVKLRLGESIVRALIRMKCPYRLQTFQIKGLDYSNIFPVVQWLIKKVMETREERGDLVRQFSESQFRKSYAMPEEALIQKNKQSAQAFISEVRAHYKVQRKFRRHHSVAPTVQHTLLEYGQLKTKDATQKDGDQSTSEDAEHKRYMDSMTSVEGGVNDIGAGVAERYFGTGFTVRDFAKPAAADEAAAPAGGQGQKQFQEKMMAGKLKQLTKDIEAKQTALVEFREQHEVKATEVKRLEAQLAQTVRTNRRIVLAIQKLDSLETPENAAILRKLKELVSVQETLKSHEQRFKASCKRHLLHMKADIEAARQSVHGGDEERIEMINQAYDRDATKLAKLHHLFTKKTREISILERKIDEVPSRLELSMYQRQFVELYDTIAIKLTETKRHYCTYNTLVDTRKALATEVEILERCVASGLGDCLCYPPNLPAQTTL